MAAAVAVASLLALLAAESHGHSSRRYFAPPQELQGRRVLSVADAAEAFTIWSTEGLRGRRLVILTGRWSRPQTPVAHPRTLAELEQRRSKAAVAQLDPMSALFAAANVGIARRMDVVMPPAVHARRAAELGGRKEFRAARTAFHLPAEGFERRFSALEGFRPPGEPALVLIEPSFFQAGVPEDLLGWLEATGLRSDLVLIARDDPETDDAGRSSAARVAERAGAVRAEPPQ